MRNGKSLKRPYNIYPKRTLADVLTVLFWLAVVLMLLLALAVFAGACR